PAPAARPPSARSRTPASRCPASRTSPPSRTTAAARPSAAAPEEQNMARYTGPRSRVARRLGVNIFGTAGEARALDRRPYPPGEHGRSRRRGQPSEYLAQLQEKQKARFSYGLSERQFRNLYDEANRTKGVTGEVMLQMLERRLDNVVYRAGLAATRPQARQFVNHGHFDVNGKRVTIPSYRVRV